MKHPLNSTFEFMPDKDLRLFILHQVITPFLDQKAVEGVRLSAGIEYKAGTQIVHGPRLDRKGKATEVLVRGGFQTQFLRALSEFAVDRDCSDR
ncbi:MAG: hypothetical protein J0L73_14985 [Verrucomicrobia bacterium]|nr:hypothetical protein [Verrucomicrobiota bacterium]